ncbi:hypothetical protein NLX62_04795 [Mycobacteriaceae bacterium Msp059]|nr:hypothetical protein [Mycobacteriaceae bacterium Msp059]
MSYRELDVASNRLARLLISEGAGPGRSVGLLAGRSVDAVVAASARGARAPLRGGDGRC